MVKEEFTNLSDTAVEIFNNDISGQHFQGQRMFLWFESYDSDSDIIFCVIKVC